MPMAKMVHFSGRSPAAQRVSFFPMVKEFIFNTQGGKIYDSLGAKNEDSVPNIFAELYLVPVRPSQGRSHFAAWTVPQRIEHE